MHMKITKIETLCLSRMHEPERQWQTAAIRAIKADCAVVVIHTDVGITGIGEACAYGVPDRIKDWVQFLNPLLLGKDPRDPAIAPVPHYRNSSYDCAVAGVDCALWDIRGKAAGMRVCDVLAQPCPKFGCTPRRAAATIGVSTHINSSMKHWVTLNKATPP
jgi:L-alanine-DL-glutamate epimerase-like enolase superfamily enzyme